MFDLIKDASTKFGYWIQKFLIDIKVAHYTTYLKLQLKKGNN